MDFRLWGLVPVTRANGPDIDASATGRLAAETVAWAPQGLTPAMGAVWTGIDHRRAVVTLPIGDRTVDVTVAVDPSGCLDEVSLQRWGAPDSRPFGFHPFGASTDRDDTFAGITIATAGQVGWGWDTDRRSEGVFFTFRVTNAVVPHITTTTRSGGPTGSCGLRGEVD